MPLHSLQVVEMLSGGGAIISLHVQLNFELEREILGFGDRVKVLAPERLKRRIKDILEHALDQYQCWHGRSGYFCDEIEK